MVGGSLQVVAIMPKITDSAARRVVTFSRCITSPRNSTPAMATISETHVIDSPALGGEEDRLEAWGPHAQIGSRSC